MYELRDVHLGVPRPPDGAASVTERLAQAYAEATRM